jgi:hypothetical protein
MSFNLILFTRNYNSVVILKIWGQLWERLKGHGGHRGHLETGTLLHRADDLL